MEKRISNHAKNLLEKKSPVNIVRFLFHTVTQGRFIELLYGVYCYIFMRPSKTATCEETEKIAENFIKENFSFFTVQNYTTYNDLVKNFGDRFPLHLAPDDFRARVHGWASDDDYLVIGEYGHDSGTIYFLTKTGCSKIEHYNKIPGFRHIHSIHKLSKNEILVATGDSKKLFDLWKIKDNEFVFEKRVMRWFGGFTTTIEINGEHYFGTDFSRRPNYIYNLNTRKKYPFPKECFTKYSEAFFPVNGRYIFCYNADIGVFGKKAVCMFDAKDKKFVFSRIIEA